MESSICTQQLQSPQLPAQGLANSVTSMTSPRSRLTQGRRRSPVNNRRNSTSAAMLLNYNAPAISNNDQRRCAKQRQKFSSHVPEAFRIRARTHAAADASYAADSSTFDIPFANGTDPHERKKWRTSLSPKAMGPRAAAGGNPHEAPS